MKKLIIAAGLLMTTSAYAQTEVLTGVTRGKDYGVVYSLPKTQIELEIKALLSIKTTGLKEDGGDLLFHCYAVPLALQGLTSLFGMGRGGTLVQ